MIVDDLGDNPVCWDCNGVGQWLIGDPDNPDIEGCSSCGGSGRLPADFGGRMDDNPICWDCNHTGVYTGLLEVRPCPDCEHTRRRADQVWQGTCWAPKPPPPEPEPTYETRGDIHGMWDKELLDDPEEDTDSLPPKPEPRVPGSSIGLGEMIISGHLIRELDLSVPDDYVRLHSRRLSGGWWAIKKCAAKTLESHLRTVCPDAEALWMLREEMGY